MSTEKETLSRVQGALYHLRRGLAPFVERRMKARHGAQWLTFASRAAGGDPRAPLDEYALLKTMIEQWRDVFDEAFPRAEKYRTRNFVSTALEARNAVSHLALALQDDEALRYLDAVHHLLRAVKAPEAEIAEARRLYDEQRRSGVAAPGAEAAAPAATVPERDEEKPGRLRPWIEVALPHPDVLANRFREAEFAANLAAVDAGMHMASDDYATAQSFFRITFLTEGLRRVLRDVLQRLAGQGGDPVIGLQTAFGGGKTHTLLAALHLAKAESLAPLDGIPALASSVGVTAWKPAKLAVFVGSSEGPDVSLRLEGGPKVYTPRGYIAGRLAGDAGLALVAEAEAARTNPGFKLLAEVFRLAGPSLVLLDELVMFARQLPDARFEAFLSFIQSLTEAAALVPNALVIGSLPESDAEAGGPRGKEALLRLEKVFGRVQSPWLPASGDET
ncbi:MAG: Swt1 family HEPN domain-containing protein, partial [Acetobacteraceae bacterium]